MKPILFQYRSRKLHTDDIAFIKALIDSYFLKGRSYISRELCKSWNWVQPNGKLKEYAARDLLLRLEEQGLVALPGRIRPKNNLKPKIFDQIPLFVKSTLGGTITGYEIPTIQVVKDPQESYLWGYLLYHYHYLGCPRLVGEHVRHIVHIGNQVVACLGWASAAWKVKDRDRFIGWDETTKRTRLHLIASNVRFLIPPWVTVKHLASKVLSLALKRLSNDWEAVYGHPVYLAETFVDTARFQGTCYQAANWLRVGKTKGSAKRGNTYRYHGQTKELFTFLEHEDVSPYNNHAEQQMRKPVLTRKVSQQNRSEDGAKTQAILMSLLRSAELQRINPVENLLASAKNALMVKTPSGFACKIAC
ncbi:MAG: DUF4338 domain-containing protein [Candidatus Brocadia sp.]|nr:DUF4338 domain-containing protein [Candidatus Brocadia sp.]